ncbi:MAG: cytochrome c [Burkholderiales bacterium]
MKPVVSALAALAVVGAYAVVVHAQTPDRQIKYRQGILQGMGWHMGVLGSMAKGERPYDAQVAARSAKFVAELAEMPWDGFGPGSDAGAPTKAKPEIWQQRAKFDNYAKEMQAETKKLADAAGKDLNALKAAVGPTGKACGNCHDDFRMK